MRGEFIFSAKRMRGFRKNAVEKHGVEKNAVGKNAIEKSAVGKSVVAATLVLLAGCAPPPPAPVYELDGSAVQEEPELEVKRADFHQVRAGDTLYDIAFQHGLEYKDIALWNGISNPNIIEVGKTLRLTPPETAAVASAVKPAAVSGVRNVQEIIPAPQSEIIAAVPAPKPKVKGKANAATAAATTKTPSDAPVKHAPSAVKYKYDKQKLKELQTAHAATQAAPAPRPAAATAAADAPKNVRRRFSVDWSWPAGGAILREFSEVSKGLDIAGDKGGEVYAAADGKVVYVGSGVKSYGRLVIVKHKNDYLSAYAHNEEILVREGQRVSRGEQISTIGDSGAAKVMLHLEVRKAGKPLDPMQVLPPKP